MTNTLRTFIATAVVAWLVLQPGLQAHAYDNSWTLQKAIDYAYAGLNERYVLGGGKFIDNNTWDSACASSCTSQQEGIDCSGFGAKVYAVPNATSYTTWAHPYASRTFFNMGSDGIGPDEGPGAGEHYWWDVTDYARMPMDLFVYQKSAGGPSNHMGVIRTINSDGTVTTREARGAKYGVVAVRRSLSTLKSWHSKFVDRYDWGG